MSRVPSPSVPAHRRLSVGTADARRMACLLTCHDRRDATLGCLAALTTCTMPEALGLHVILVDDGSSDDTAAAVGERFPRVEVIPGDGSLYWNGGMRRALGAAMAQGFDDYLWLNDDTWLDADAIDRLYACRQALSARGESTPNIIVGATRDPSTGELTYGGLVARSPASPHYLVKLPASPEPQRCRTFNGNCVLMPDAVVRRLGNLDEHFVHALGDWDYGLRATRAGIGVWVAPGFVGTCQRSSARSLPPSVARSVRARLRHVCSVKQVPPRAWYLYVRRHCGWRWPAEFAKPYASAIGAAVVAKFREPDSP